MSSFPKLISKLQNGHLHKIKKSGNDMKENTMNKPQEDQKGKANLSWLDLTEEELLKVSEVSVCMYKGENDNKPLG